MIGMLVGVLAIAGTPLFSGYYSKDAIVAQAMYFFRGDATNSVAAAAHPNHALLFYVPLVGAGLTAFYMFRMLLLTFAGKPRNHHVHEHAHESPRVMWVPLVVLAAFSIDWFGWLGWLGVKGASWVERIHNVIAFEGPYPQLPHPDHVTHDLAGILALSVAAGGALLAYLIYGLRLLDPAQVRQQFAPIHTLLVNKWYFDELYDAVFVRPARGLARLCRSFDLGVIDRVVDGAARGMVRLSDLDGRFDLGVIDGLVNLVADWVYAAGAWLRVFQTGRLRQYVVFLVVATIGIFTVLTYWVM